MKRSLYPIITLLLFAGCSSDIPYPEEPVQDLVPLELSSVRIEGDVSTRATTTPLTNGNLGIFLSNASGYTPAPYRYTGSAGGWTSDSPLYLGPGTATICAWYPYEYYVPANSGSLVQFPIKAQLNTPENDLLFFTSVSGINNRNPRQTIQLKHAHALLNFRISRDVTYQGEGKITSFTLETGYKLLDVAKINISNGQFSGANIVHKLTFPVEKTVRKNNTETIGILIPPLLIKETTVKLTVDGKEVSGYIKGPVNTSTSGIAATINLKLRQDLPVSVTVQPTDSAGGEIIW